MSKRSLFILAFIVVLLLVHFSLQRKALVPAGFITKKITAIVYLPVVEKVLQLKRACVDLFDNYVWLVHVKQENKTLQETVRMLAIQNQSLQSQLKLQSEYETAAQQFAYLNSTLLPVALLGFDPFIQSKAIWIDAGTKEGVALNNVLISQDGLVGRVIDVYDHSSKVLLLIDRYFAVDVVSKTTETRALVSGLNSSRLVAQHLPYLSQLEFVEKDRSLNEGDELLTSGMSELFPMGIPVGTIVSVDASAEGLFEKSYVMPSVDFTKLNRVYVLIPQQPEKSL